MIKTNKISKKSLSYLFTALPAMAIMATSITSYADEKIVDILPPTTQENAETRATMNGEETHPDLRLTPDKSELIRLKTDANSVIIGNPIHINVMVDSPRTLIIVPRIPGATHFTVLDKNGQILMQRHVIVASPTKDYIKIKRVCPEDSDNCQNTSIFYCPDSCHEIGLGKETGSSSQYSASSKTSDDNNTSDSGANTGNDKSEGNE